MKKLNIIQIGCDDCKDEVFDFIKNNDEKIGTFVVIDASQEAITIAKEKYSFLGNKIKAVNVAVGTTNGIAEFFLPVGELHSAHASLSKAHVENHEHPQTYSVFVPCLTINDLLTSINLDVIDYFFIDCEGYDVDILLQADLPKFNIKRIKYEFYHSDGTYTTGAKNNLLMKKLNELNYQFVGKDQYNNFFSLKESP